MSSLTPAWLRPVTRPAQTGRGPGTDESLAALQRQLNQARQDLAAAYHLARAVGYRLGSTEMAVLADAERNFQQVRSRWQDRHRQDPPAQPVPAAPAPGEAAPGEAALGELGSRPDAVIDLTADTQQLDLDGERPARSRPSPGGPAH